MDWFRSWHGAPQDPKWMKVARNAKVKPGVVVAIAWWLMDQASQSEDRGDVSTFDIETCSIFTGFETTEIADVLDAMIAAGVIINGRLASWEKRQPLREDTSGRERQARLRARRKEEKQQGESVTKRYVTPRNARTEQNRSEQILPSHGGQDSESESETLSASRPQARPKEHDLCSSWSDIPRLGARPRHRDPSLHGSDSHPKDHAA